MQGMETTKRYQRITSGSYDGYCIPDLGVEITDNGAGFGRAEGSGRWAVVIDGRWIANEDTLKAAKARVTAELAMHHGARSRI